MDINEFCSFMEEYLDEAPKFNLGSPSKWIGPPSGLEKSIGRKNMPPVHVSNKEQTYIDIPGPKDPPNAKTKINLNPDQVRGYSKRYRTSDARSAEAGVAHELGHLADYNKGNLPNLHNWDISFSGSDKQVKDELKGEIRANKEGEALLAKHNRPPMHPKIKKGSIASYHSDILADRAYRGGFEKSGTDKTVRDQVKYASRLKRQRL